jgi:hypothetical protein
MQNFRNKYDRYTFHCTAIKITLVTMRVHLLIRRALVPFFCLLLRATRSFNIQTIYAIKYVVFPLSESEGDRMKCLLSQLDIYQIQDVLNDKLSIKLIRKNRENIFEIYASKTDPSSARSRSSSRA